MKRLCVVGCPRSGTTLVQSLIGAHPLMYAFPETDFAALTFGDGSERFFGKKFQHSSVLRGLVRTARMSLRVATHESERRLQAFCREYSEDLPPGTIGATGVTTQLRRWMESFDRIAARNEKAGWSEKTPLHLAYIPDIAAACPDMKFVHVRRDAARVVDSLLSAHARFPESNAWRDFSNIDYCISVWKRANALSEDYFRDTVDYRISFDDLLEDPEGFTDDFFRYLDLPDMRFDEIVSSRNAASDRIVNANEPWKGGVFRDIEKSGKAFQVLSERDVAYVRENTRPS